MSEHALIAPSALDITLHCPGSVALQQPYLDQEETDEQKDGTAGHWVALCYASGEALPVAGDTAPNGVEITEEMVDGALLYLEAIGIRQPNAKLEQRVSINRIHPQCWGTPDYRDYNPAKKRIRIVDYKFGFKYVEVFELAQTVAYGVGYLDELGLDDQDTYIEFVIVQPRYYRANPIRTWCVRASDLRGFVNRITLAVEKALSSKPPVISGDHCTFCLARHVCGTYQRAAAICLDFAGLPDVMLGDPIAVGNELSAIDRAITRLKGRKTGLEQQATAYIRGGQRVPNYHLTQTTGRLKWTVDDAIIIDMATLLGVDVANPPKAKTPTQCKKLLDESVITSYSARAAGKLELAPISNTEMTKVFSNGNGI